MDRRLRRVAHQNGRELHALVLLLTWIGCFEVAPFLHTATHGDLAPHTHEADGGARALDHCHGHRCHGPGDGSEPALGVDRSHGSHALLHRGVATLVPSPAVPPVPSAPVSRLDAPAPDGTRPSFAPLRAPRARAPPAPRC